MKVSVIWEPANCSIPDFSAAAPSSGGGNGDGGGGGGGGGGSFDGDGTAPVPMGPVWGPKREAGWAPVGVTVDEDTVPHILTFTACRGGGGGGNQHQHQHQPKHQPKQWWRRRQNLGDEQQGWLDLPPL